jgi:hypothetical protein
MAKRKPSTFERLRNGRFQWNRKQRREVERRLNSADPGLEIIHPHAAGIDVGNESHFGRPVRLWSRSLTCRQATSSARCLHVAPCKAHRM